MINNDDQQYIGNIANLQIPPAQKFKPGTIVKIADVMPKYMRHFSAGVYAIVEYTYAQRYGGNTVDQYALIVRELPKHWSYSAWYDEEQLTQVADENIIKELMPEIKTYYAHRHNS